MTFLGSASPTASSHFPTNRALVISHECSPDIPAVGLAANILPLSGGGPEEDGWLQWCGGSALPFHPGCLCLHRHGHALQHLQGPPKRFCAPNVLFPGAACWIGAEHVPW
eukprot:GGOE01011070.1.p4 GENE.GGOE01011070.1~~GGOE01011070.1.p4  ORF type:complete len:110 (-),score=0.56 GGOE01011070.1:373-702(-)